MEREDFERLVEEGYLKLPQWVRDRISNVAILVEDEPSAAVRRAERLAEDETLLGYYQGTPLSQRGESYGVGGLSLPDTITIYMVPTLDMALDECPPDAGVEAYRDTVRRIVADTVWHEFAHHFGMDEGEVREREDERGVSS